jgi:hypothetical protein
MLTVICRQNILRTTTIKEVLILVTNILDQIVLKVYNILAYITKNYIALIYYAKIVHLLCNLKNLYICRALNETKNILTLSRLCEMSKILFPFLLRFYFCQSRTHLNWRFLGRLVICHNEMHIQSSA